MKKILLSSTIVVSLAAFGASLAYAQESQRGGPRVSFEKIDTNGDGALTMEEFVNRGQARFDETDTNGDGQLDPAELTAAAARERAQMIARLMERKDTNNDGMLSFEEMQPREPGRVFERADTDGNSQISEEEWAAAKKKMRERGPENGSAGN